MATTQQMTQSGLPDAPRGMDLLDCPGLNKGTAFTEEERSRFGLHGILPPHVESLDEQVVRAYEAYQRKDDDLERHIYLRALQDTVDFSNPDLVKSAESSGAKGYRIGAAEQLLPTLRKALADDAVSVIACPVDYSENIRLTDKLGKLVQPI
jgi:hypothetical protein